MNTVYIKCSSRTRLVNADLIESILWINNEIYVNGTPEEPFFKIYAGKAINAEKAISKIVYLIHQAKMVSSREEAAVILDFSKDLDNYEESIIKDLHEV